MVDKIYFLTGNENKLREARGFFDPIIVEQVNIEVDEIQSIDPKEIIRHKLHEAMQKTDLRPLFVEDVSLCFAHYDYLLPGPLVKWFQQGETRQLHMLKALEQVEDRRARVICSIGCAFSDDHIEFLEGSDEGTIAKEPRGDNKFGFDPIYCPNDGDGRTFAEMTLEEKQDISHRAKAQAKLKEFLLARS